MDEEAVRVIAARTNGDAPDVGLVLRWSLLREEELRVAVTDSLERSRATSSRIGAIEARLGALGLAPRSAASPSPARAGLDGGPLRPWHEIESTARANLLARGVPHVSLDELLDPAEVQAIEERFRGGFRLEAELDRCDLLAVAAAGLCAALVDLLLVRIPATSPLTQWMKKWDVPADNQLASWFKVSYDRVAGVDVSGFGPRSHRLQTFGHDPLVGLVVGTFDLLRGGMTTISREGAVQFTAGTGDPFSNPLVAFAWVLGHVLSDAATKMGVPAPGWTLTQFLQVGSFGPNDRTVAELARFMYLKGYDSRHFLTTAAPVAAAELVLRGYVGVRRYLDPGYDAAFNRLGEVAGADGVGANPRYVAMALAAHGVAVAANAGKIALHGGNPLAFGYAQWVAFVRAGFRWVNLRLRSPTDVLLGYGGANERILDSEDPLLPSLG